MATKFTFKQFQALYPNDDACLDAILERRYGKIDCCPNCGVVSKLTRIDGRRAYACREGCHIYPCAGTVFEKSTTLLTLWFHAMYLMTATRNGVSAKELQRQLGVTYKCAWRIGHQLRELMAVRNYNEGPEQLSGHVEVDETYVGGKKRFKGGRRDQGRHLDNKTVVMGMLERGGNVRAVVVRDNKKQTLIPQLMLNVEEGTVISSDNLSAYQCLPSLGYPHGIVKHHMNEWKRGPICTNGIEGFWSHLKRGIRSTHVAVSPKHLQKYVGEFEFRYNNRSDPADMFRRLLQQVSVSA